jgi:ElaB/YqjD/DUF883 family membrane-anchored ribosome-binding protein
MFTVRVTGHEELDKTQGDIKKSFDTAQALIAAVAKQAKDTVASQPQQPSGVTPGVYTIAGITSITVDVYGRITKIV